MAAWPLRTAATRDSRPSPEALLAEAQAGGPRPAEDLPRRRAGRRQDLRDAVRGAGQARATASTSSSASSRPTAARRPRRCSPASRSSRAGRSTTRAASSRRWISTPSWRAARKLVLVDELAHTNAPGSRHPKRYLDVEELLAAGIDVYTTLNIQHVESLNDVVAQITRIRVRETVPDSVLDRADDIEVIDLTPDDLIQRLQRGQGLRPAAGRARRPPLLLARQSDRAARAGAAPHRAARRRADARRYMRRTPSPARGPAGERVLVCVSEAPGTRRRSSATPGAWPTGCTRRGPRSMSRPRAPAPRATPSATASPRRCGSPSGSAARPSRSPARDIADDVVAYAAGQQHHPDRHRQVRRARAGSRCCTARWCTS